MGITGVLVVVLLLVCLLVGGLALRRFRLVRGGGVDVALRKVRASAPDSTRGWNLGVARYQGDEFVWYRVISLGGRADMTLNRLGLEIVDRRRPGPAEEYVIPIGATVLRCRDGESLVELAMNPDALTGFLAWLEATPPGRYGFSQAS